MYLTKIDNLIYCNCIVCNGVYIYSTWGQLFAYYKYWVYFVIYSSTLLLLLTNQSIMMAIGGLNFYSAGISHNSNHGWSCWHHPAWQVYLGINWAGWKLSGQSNSTTVWEHHWSPWLPENNRQQLILPSALLAWMGTSVWFSFVQDGHLFNQLISLKTMYFVAYFKKGARWYCAEFFFIFLLTLRANLQTTVFKEELLYLKE